VSSNFASPSFPSSDQPSYQIVPIHLLPALSIVIHSIELFGNPEFNSLKTIHSVSSYFTNPSQHPIHLLPLSSIDIAVITFPGNPELFSLYSVHVVSSYFTNPSQHPIHLLPILSIAIHVI